MYMLQRITLTSSILLCMALCACTGGGAQGQIQPGTTQGADTLRDTLAQLDAMPVPEGADAATFTMLKSKLRDMLLACSAGKCTAAAPLSKRSRIIDLVIQADTGGARYYWTYRNEGDYNLDGSVNIADLAILGINFGKSTASGDWNTACAADGNRDGMVNLADLASIGIGFNNQVTGYVIEYSDFAGSGATWTAAGAVLFDNSTIPPGFAKRWYSYLLTSPQAGYYRAVPYQNEVRGIEGVAAPWAVDHRGNWWTFGRDLKHTRRSPYTGPATNAVRWSCSLGSEVVSSPAINAVGTVYVAEVSGVVHAFTADGDKIWTYTCEDDIWGSPVVGEDGKIYIGCASGNLYALNADGTMHWTYNCGAAPRYPLTIDGNGSIILNNGTNTMAITSDGALDWCIYDTFGKQAPAIGDGGVVYINSDEGLKAITQAGSVLWTATTGGAGSSPAVGTDGTIYVGSNDNSLYAVRADGTLRWVFPTGDEIISSAAIGADGTIYFGSCDCKFYAVNPDGSKKWEHNTGDIIYASPAIGGDGAIYFPCVDGDIYSMSPDGAVNWRYVVQYGFYSSPAIGADGTLYVGSMNYTMFAFGPGGA